MAAAAHSLLQRHQAQLACGPSRFAGMHNTQQEPGVCAAAAAAAQRGDEEAAAADALLSLAARARSSSASTAQPRMSNGGSSSSDTGVDAAGDQGPSSAAPAPHQPQVRRAQGTLTSAVACGDIRSAASRGQRPPLTAAPVTPPTTAPAPQQQLQAQGAHAASMLQRAARWPAAGLPQQRTQPQQQAVQQQAACPPPQAAQQQVMHTAPTGRRAQHQTQQHGSMPRPPAANCHTHYSSSVPAAPAHVVVTALPPVAQVPALTSPFASFAAAADALQGGGAAHAGAPLAPARSAQAPSPLALKPPRSSTTSRSHHHAQQQQQHTERASTAAYLQRRHSSAHPRSVSASWPTAAAGLQGHQHSPHSLERHRSSAPSLAGAGGHIMMAGVAAAALPPGGSHMHPLLPRELLSPPPAPPASSLHPQQPQRSGSGSLAASVFAHLGAAATHWGPGTGVHDGWCALAAAAAGSLSSATSALGPLEAHELVGAAHVPGSGTALVQREGLAPPQHGHGHVSMQRQHSSPWLTAAPPGSVAVLQHTHTAAAGASAHHPVQCGAWPAQGLAQQPWLQTAPAQDSPASKRRRLHAHPEEHACASRSAPQQQRPTAYADIVLAAAAAASAAHRALTTGELP
jgi:hypothetical protein